MRAESEGRQNRISSGFPKKARKTQKKTNQVIKKSL